MKLAYIQTRPACLDYVLHCDRLVPHGNMVARQSLVNTIAKYHSKTHFLYCIHFAMHGYAIISTISIQDFNIYALQIVNSFYAMHVMISSQFTKLLWNGSKL